jgi:hypothetical protein
MWFGGLAASLMLEDFSRSAGPRRARSSERPEGTAAPDAAETGGPLKTAEPIVLRTFGAGTRQPGYRWWLALSVLVHVLLVGLTLWLNRKVVFPRSGGVAVVLRKPPPPKPPPAIQETKPEALKKGSRGVNLPKAVAKDIQPEFELSFAAERAPDTSGPTGKWVGGVGTGIAHGPGWSNGSESGALLRRSLARAPQELNTGWECDFPEKEPDNRLVVRIRVHVSDSGRPMHVTVIRPGPPAFNRSAVECAMRERFHPALDMAGNPTEGDREVGILFFRTGVHSFKEEPPPPPAVPTPPPLNGPQPDLPVQLDETPAPGEK